jgi:hypothetical protein
MTTSAIPALADPTALAAATPALQPGNAAGAQAGAHAGYGISLTDLGAFEQALARASAGQGATLQARPAHSPAEAMQALFRPLGFIDGEAASLSARAHAAVDAQRSMTPSEMVMLSVKCHEFMFHCQLTSNAANRTSDGLQQLFRQQA